MDFRLPYCKVKPNVVLGHGTYGDVLEVEYKGKVYAAKKYRIFGLPTIGASRLGAFGREHEILAHIRHRNIVPYYGICKLTTDSSTVIVMQKMDVNLGTHLEMKPNIPIGEKLALLYDIANGLDHLHSQKPAIIHRDLTAGNVLLNLKNGVAKISDFGNSRMVDLKATPELMTSSPGTLDYMPPEAMEGGDYNEKIDVFSYGHLAVYIMIQRRPHPLLRPIHREGQRLMARTEVERRKVYLTEIKDTLDGGDVHPLYSILVSCLQDEPDPRPCCQDILRCSIFSPSSNTIRKNDSKPMSQTQPEKTWMAGMKSKMKIAVSKQITWGWHLAVVMTFHPKLALLHRIKYYLVVYTCIPHF